MQKQLPITKEKEERAYFKSSNNHQNQKYQEWSGNSKLLRIFWLLRSSEQILELRYHERNHFYQVGAELDPFFRLQILAPVPELKLPKKRSGTAPVVGADPLRKEPFLLGGSETKTNFFISKCQLRLRS